MRTSAHATGDEAFLRRSWDPETCPPVVVDRSREWVELQVRDCSGGGALDRVGSVTFAARYLRQGTTGWLIERSHFVRSGIRWIYRDGEPLRR